MKRNGTKNGYSARIAEVRSAVARRDDAAVAEALKQTVAEYGARTVPLLIRILRGNHGIAAKHVAALAVSDLSAQAALPALFGVIRSRRFRNHRGTFVYALWPLDWRRYARELAQLIADPSYEVREMAVKALEHEAGRRLTRTQRRSMINALLQSLYGGNADADMRDAIAYALSLLIDQEAQPAKDVLKQSRSA